MSVTETTRWRKMASAPKDGSRIIVVIRASEQGPASADVVHWGRPERAADECWMSTDSAPDCAIVYEDWEVAHWMPLPPSLPGVRTADLLDKLPQIPRIGEELGGSGI